jgi:hypothetical protein
MNMAPELAGRVSVHFTRHHHRSRCGRGWITVDGAEIANFCDWSVYRHNPDHRRSDKDKLAGYGEFRAWDFKSAAWALVHEGAEKSLSSGDPLKMSLAVLHRKIGKTRIRTLISQQRLHPLVRHLCELRLSLPNNRMQATCEDARA